MESSCEENMISNTKLKGITSTKSSDTYLWTAGARGQQDNRWCALLKMPKP